MVKSMTGFGKGEATLQNKRITVEIRSLNSKQLDLSLRLPAVYRQSEYELRNVIARTIQRGKVDVFVSVESQSVETSARINRRGVPRIPPADERHARVSHGIERRLRRHPAGHHAPAGRGSHRIRSHFGGGARRADRRRGGRRRTARRIPHTGGSDPDRRPAAPRGADRSGTSDEVVPFEKARTETIRTRILDNLAKLPVEVDRNRLEQEMIFYLEKLDITEEKVRLTNHCKYFREVAAGEEGAGRKLGFIAQEMGREINTMGSKANESNIQILVVKMKDELEKIKEQVLNIL